VGGGEDGDVRGWGGGVGGGVEGEGAGDEVGGGEAGGEIGADAGWWVLATSWYGMTPVWGVSWSRRGARFWKRYVWRRWGKGADCSWLRAVSRWRGHSWRWRSWNQGPDGRWSEFGLCRWWSSWCRVSGEVMAGRGKWGDCLPQAF